MFLVLDRVPNLASQVLRLSLRHLSRDTQVMHDYPILLAEMFVGRSRFDGTCYRAVNWCSPGFTRGCSRRPGGMPKEVYVFDLSGAASEPVER